MILFTFLLGELWGWHHPILQYLLLWGVFHLVDILIQLGDCGVCVLEVLGRLHRVLINFAETLVGTPKSWVELEGQSVLSYGFLLFA